MHFLREEMRRGELDKTKTTSGEFHLPVLRELSMITNLIYRGSNVFLCLLTWSKDHGQKYHSTKRSLGRKENNHDGSFRHDCGMFNHKNKEI